MFEKYFKEIQCLNYEIEIGRSVCFEYDFEKELINQLNDENNFYIIIKEFTDIIYENKENNTFLINLFLIISRMNIPEKYSYFQLTISSLALNFGNNEIKDYGIRISEMIKDKNLRKNFLQTLKVSSWLQDYVDDLIEEC